MKSSETFRIGTVFHETFALSRSAIAQVLKAVSSLDSHRSLFEYLRETTELGTRYCKAMPRYAQGAGLLTRGSALSIPFGEIAVQHDPHLMRKETQWLMHYHLSAPHGPGPLFWHGLVIEAMKPGRTFTTADVARDLERVIHRFELPQPTDRALQSTATVFVGTYADNDGLSALGLLEKVGQRYRMLEPEPPPLWVLAYTLADYWEHHWSDRLTVNLSDLGRPGGWASLFWMNQGAMGRQLSLLKQEGVIDLHRVAQPYQVVKLWADKVQFLEKIYGGKGTEAD